MHKVSAKLHQQEKKLWFGLYIIYVLLRAVTFRLLDAPRIAPDTYDYQEISSFPLFSIEFWTSQRPPFYPLLIKFFGQNFDVLPLFQFFLSILTWGLLAYALARLLKNFWLRFFSFVFVLLFSTSILIVPWDAVIMTESLNFSFFAVILALWLLQIHDKSWEILILLMIVSFLWTFLRETNVWLISLTGGAVFLWGLFLRDKKRLIVGLILVFTFFINYISVSYPSGMNQRWVFPFLNVVGKKVLRNDNRLLWFEQQGMPVTPELLSMAGEFANGRDRYFYTAPELESFREWVTTEGRREYMIYLLVHRQYFIVRPFMDASYLDSNQSTDSFQPEDFHLLLPIEIYIFIHPEIPGKILLWIGLGIGIIDLIMIFYRKEEIWGILLITLLLFIPHNIITWHGDTMSMSRHTLLASVQLRIAIWLSLFFILNTFLPTTKIEASQS